MARARRGRNEGAIFQRADGYWVATLNIGYDEHGKRKRRTIYGKTKREAQEKLARLQADSLNGMLGEPQKLLVTQFLTRWLEDAARPSIRTSTYIQYERMLRLHINPRIGGVPLSKLTPAHIQGLYAVMEREGASARLRQIVHAVLHRSLSQALKWGYVHRNLCDAVDKPKAPKKPMQVLTKEEVQHFLAAAQEDRLYALFLLALATGLRQGELLGLHWSDVDLQARTISVQFNLLEVQGKLYRDEPKSAKGRRLIELPGIAVAALREHRKRMLAEGHPGPWVFCGTTGENATLNWPHFWPSWP